MTSSLATVSYIGAIILFILSLGGLANPETARRGNLFGIISMTIAVLATVLGDGRPATGGSGLRDAGPVVGWLVPLVRTGWDLATFATLGCLLVAGWLTAGDRSDPAARPRAGSADRRRARPRR